MGVLKADGPASLIDRMRHTRAVNIEAVINAQFRHGEAAAGFHVVDPYGPNTARVVHRWAQNPGRGAGVCAIRFSDAERNRYELRDFKSATAAIESGFTVTHQGRCGSCSTLRDLAIYLSVTDLATPARNCARRLRLEQMKRCFQERIGFSAYCAESWAYNAAHTKHECLGTCIADYGLLNLLFDRGARPNVDASGRLRPCLACDEAESGPGFRYSAGRTRRNSGIRSAIQRPASEIYPVDHSLYFR